MTWTVKGSRRFAAAGFMTLIDSAEDAEPRVLAATMILPGRGVIDSVAPPISGLADFVEGMAAALEELE